MGGMLQVIVGARQQQVIASSFDPVSGLETTHYDAKRNVAFDRAGGAADQAALALCQLHRRPDAGADAAFRRGEYQCGVRTLQDPAARRACTKLDLGGFGASLSAFQISLPSGVIDPITKIYSLDGEQRNRGIELNTFGEVAPGVRVLGGVTWLDARLTQTNRATSTTAIARSARPTCRAISASSGTLRSCPG